MRNRIISFAIILVLSMGMILPVMNVKASELPRLTDEADILTDAEEAEVLAKLDEISERQEFDVVIATVNDYEQSDVKNAAYDYYDYNGFGYGENNDGILLYLSMGERELNISGTGYGIEAFTDFGREQMLEQIKPELGEDDFYNAFLEFADIADTYITEAKAGTPYDVDHPAYEEEMDLTTILMMFGGFVLVGAIIAKIIVKSAEGQLKSVRCAASAHDYMRKGSLRMYNSVHYLVDSRITSVYSPEKEEGSTIDRGSSGVSHSSTSSKF